MNEADRRIFVERMYPGPRWKRRVKAMTDAQVFAIWKRAQDKQPKHRPKHKESGDGEAPF